MELILSRLDNVGQLHVEFTIPNIEVSEKMESLLLQIIKQYKAKGCIDEIVSLEENNFVNYLFEISYEDKQGDCQALMITSVLDEHENPKVFSKYFQRAAKKIKNVPRVKLAFMGSQGPSDLKQVDAERKVKQILSNLAGQIKKLFGGKAGLAQIIFLGVHAVGKTTIIK